MKILVVTPTLGKSPFLKNTLMGLRPVAEICYYLVVGPSSVYGDVRNSMSEFGDLDWQFVAEPPSTVSLYSAINNAIEACRFRDWDFFTYINDDDFFGFEFSFVLRKHLEEFPNCFAFGNVHIINDAGFRFTSIPVETNPSWFEALLSQGISPLNQQGMIVPRELWDKLGGFRTEYKLCADLDFWLRAHRMGWPFKYYPFEVGCFRIREGQLSGDTKKLEAEIAEVVARDAPRKIGWLEKFYARWQFRILNASIYIRRLLTGHRIRGMEIMAGR
jgi:GT2 family glycosyltransferase